jgi:hypothetical protein
MLRVLRGRPSLPQGGAPAIFGDELLERPIEIVGVLHRRLDIILAEHGGADFQTLVEPRLVHGEFL